MLTHLQTASDLPTFQFSSEVICRIICIVFFHCEPEKLGRLMKASSQRSLAALSGVLPGTSEDVVHLSRGPQSLFICSWTLAPEVEALMCWGSLLDPSLVVWGFGLCLPWNDSSSFLKLQFSSPLIIPSSRGVNKTCRTRAATAWGSPCHVGRFLNTRPELALENTGLPWCQRSAQAQHKLMGILLRVPIKVRHVCTQRGLCCFQFPECLWEMSGVGMRRRGSCG